METIISPITQKQNVKLISNIKSTLIIEKYQKELDTNVSLLFQNTESICIYECLDTGYLFYYPYSIVGDEKLYDDLKINMPLIYHTPYYPLWKWEYDIALNYIKNIDSVLEIGCGSGVFLDKLNNLNKNRKLKGLELNQFSVNEAKHKNIDAEVETIQNFASKNDYQYDVVTFFQVLEHVCDIHEFLESSISCLSPNGKLIIAVPYNNPFLFNHDIYNTLNMPPHHMGLWNAKAFTNLPKYYPLKLERLIIEKLPNQGYDFDRFYEINKDAFYKPNFPLKKLYDKLYYRFLKRFHSNFNGKNIIAIFTKV